MIFSILAPLFLLFGVARGMRLLSFRVIDINPT